MRHKNMFTVCRSAFLSIAVVCALIFSFGIHSIEMAHEHPGHAHSDGAYHPGEVENILSLSEYIHANEQKLFLFILIAFLIFGSMYVPAFLQGTHSAFVRLIQTSYIRFLHVRQHWCFFKSNYHSYLVAVLKAGILHPKSY